jgi:predicted transcriptional regulator YdeE
MEPEIVPLGPLILAGFSFYGDPFAESSGWTEENEIGRLWSRFTAYLAHHPAGLPGVREEGVAYEVHVESAETATKGHQEVFIGLAVERATDVPVELLVKVLPAATYAVFTLSGEEIAGDWSATIGAWLSQAPYEPLGGYGFQRYDERFRGVDQLADSTLEVYVPLKAPSDDAATSDL